MEWQHYRQCLCVQCAVTTESTMPVNYTCISLWQDINV